MPVAAELDPESILRELDRHGVRYVLIGGLAATLHGADHRTNDVQPAGTTGYADLCGGALAVTVSGNRVALAALADVIRSKEAANRPKDREALPRLRALLNRLNRQ